MDLFEYNNPLASVEVALNGLYDRDKSISGNIANVDTPDYKRQVTSFEEQLAKVQSGNKLSDIPLKVTNPKHFSNEIFKISDIKPQTTRDYETDIHSNGNNVDIDAEMLRLAKTGMQFRAISDMAKRQFEGLKGIIRS
jgi:flagellar basal-body rod protein FlgB